MIHKNLKRVLTSLIAVPLSISLAACSGSASSGSESTAGKTETASETKAASEEKATTKAEDTAGGTTLEVAVDFGDIRLDEFKKIIADFEKETGVKVQLTAPGSDFETVLKTRMASNDLPDVWTTHGWSVMRYSDYLMPLNDQAWYGSITDDAKNVITDEQGNIYVLPATVGISAVMYNADVLEAAGVVPEEIRTTADFESACEKIKALGVTPIFIGGKEASNGAGFINTYLFPMMLTNDGAAYPSADTLRDGTFDWQKTGTPVMQKFADYINKGYINENYSTADTAEMQKALGEGRCGFIVRSILNLAVAKSYVPDANLGVLPVPYYGDGGKNMFQVGEGSCFGVWKDTKNKEAALQLLDYIATKNVIPGLCETEGSVPGLSGIELGESYATDAYYASIKQYDGNLMYDNVFDRQYFPSGMWSVMSEATTGIALDPSENGVKSAVSLLEENYADKYEEAHAKN